MNNLKLIVTIEREDGSTYVQNIAWNKKNESVYEAINKYEKIMGEGYRVCDWWII